MLDPLAARCWWYVASEPGDMPSVEGEGERVTIPEVKDAIVGLWIDRRTVSSVFSILRSESAMASCFLWWAEMGWKSGWESRVS